MLCRWMGAGLLILLPAALAQAELSLVEAAARNDASALEAISITPQNRSEGDAVRGWRPMLYACRAGNAQLVQRLIDAGDDLNMPSVDQRLPLCLAPTPRSRM